MHVVKEMLGHQSIKQTEEYALTEQSTISREMQILENKISSRTDDDKHDPISILEKIEKDLNLLKVKSKNKENSKIISQLKKYEKKIKNLKAKLA